MGIHYIHQEDQKQSHYDGYQREIILTVFKKLRKEFYEKATPQEWFSEDKYQEFCALVGESHSVIMWATTYEYPLNPMKDEDEEYDIEYESYDTPMKDLLAVLTADGVSDPMAALKVAKYESHAFNMYYGEYLRYSYVVIPLKKEV